MSKADSNVVDIRELVKSDIPIIGPKGEKFTLVPASGNVHTDYMEKVLKNMEVSPEGEILEMNISKVNADKTYLLSQTLIHNESGNAIGEELHKWPSSSISHLASLAEGLLTTISVEESKKGLRNVEAGSK